MIVAEKKEIVSIPRISEKESVIRIINEKTLHTQHTGPLDKETPFIYEKEK